MCQDKYINDIVHRAYKIATAAAMSGRPLGGIQWVPPRTASENSAGFFVVTDCPPMSGSDRAPWE